VASPQPYRAQRRRRSPCGDTRLHAFDAGEQGEQFGGGAAIYWSPALRRRRHRATADTGARSQGEPGRKRKRERDGSREPEAYQEAVGCDVEAGGGLDQWQQRRPPSGTEGLIGTSGNFPESSSRRGGSGRRGGASGMLGGARRGSSRRRRTATVELGFRPKRESKDEGG
jgi:hypothetical protein